MTDIINQSLFSMPTFTKGAARTVSLFGGLDKYKTSKTPKEADRKAMAQDWKSVGQDLKVAIEQYGKNSSK
jgi:hypothetical protein